MDSNNMIPDIRPRRNRTPNLQKLPYGTTILVIIPVPTILRRAGQGTVFLVVFAVRLMGPDLGGSAGSTGRSRPF